MCWEMAHLTNQKVDKKNKKKSKEQASKLMMFYKRIYIWICDQKKILNLNINFPWLMAKEIGSTTSQETENLPIRYQEKDDR